MILKNERGVTLVEMMVAVAASTVIAYVIFLAIRVTAGNFETASVKMSLQTSGREGLYRMIQELRTSAPSRITIASGGGTITFNVPNTSTPVTSGYGVNWGDQIQYAMGTGSNSTKVIRTNVTTGSTKVMAQDVTALTFTGNTGTAPSRVTVAMSLQRNLVNGRTIPATALQVTGQARIRNT